MKSQHYSKKSQSHPYAATFNNMKNHTPTHTTLGEKRKPKPNDTAKPWLQTDHQARPIVISNQKWKEILILRLQPTWEIRFQHTKIQTQVE
jgi:hypothetical protein